MAVDASVRLREIATALKEAGDTGNMNALRRGIRAAPVPMISAVRQAAIARLPRAGGLNEYEASQKFRVAVLAGARTTGARIIGKASQQTDKGSVRHPYFGTWYSGQASQSIPEAAGWFSDTLREKSAEVTLLIEAELEKAAARIRSL